MQFNSVNVYHQEKISFLDLPQIKEVIDAKTWFQKVAYWVADKAGLFQWYFPKEKVINKKTIKIEGDDLKKISKAVLEFMREDPSLNPQKDLIVLFGHESFYSFIGSQMAIMQTDLQFGRSSGQRYNGIEVRCIGYIEGVLVLRRKDLVGA